MSTNDGGHTIEVRIGTMQDEMQALDALGPITRRAIYELPMRISAAAVLLELKNFEEKELLKIPEGRRHLYCISFSDPRLDQYVADGLREAARETLKRDFTEQEADYGMKPIVPTYSVKSLREQRRSTRRIRW